MEPGEKREPRTVSETRLVTTVGNRAKVEFALNQAESYVARIGPSPTSRRLGLALEPFRRTVESWKMRTPTDEQVCLVLEQVLALRELAQNDVPTVRFRRLA